MLPFQDNWRSFDLMVILAFVGSISTKNNDFQCPQSAKICLCRKTSTGNPSIANCGSRNLSIVPHFIIPYEKFIFANNHLYNLTDFTFLPIASAQLSEMDISNCSVHFVSYDTFLSLPALRVLNSSLNRNINLKDLRSAMRKSNISAVDLSGIPNIENFFQNNVQLRQLETLAMRSCELTHLKQKLFKTLPNLKELDISQNVFKNIEDLLFIRSIEILTATFCHLEEFPSPQQPSFLKTLNISNNKIEMFENVINGHYFVGLLNIIADSNPLKKIEPSTFSKFSSLQFLSLSDIKTESLIFRGIKSMSLKSLNIANSCLLKRQFPDVFSESVNIENLTLNGINLSDWNNSNFCHLFGPLYKTLKVLKLSKTSLKKLPETAFRKFSNLDRLDLSNNYLINWNVNTFPNITLARLNLRNNSIKLLNQSSFPEMIWKNVIFLDVQNNPFTCNCEIHWFRQWMKGQYYKLAGRFGSKLVCKSPKGLTERLLVDYDPTFEDCFPLDVSMILAIATCIVCVVGTSLLNCFIKPVDDTL